MEGSLRQIALSELGDTVGTPPSTRLKESVARIGVIQPVILANNADDSGEIRTVIVDGNRRIAAARAANLTQVPAIVFELLEPATMAETTLATNTMRSANYLAEFWALKSLERNQYSNDELLAASGMSQQTINLRGQLSNLNRDLFVALRHGEISQTEAIATAKLPRYQQDELSRRFERFGKLTRKDIKEVSDPVEAAGPRDEIATALGKLAEQANKAGYNKIEFLDLAARMWDEATS